MFDGRNCDDIDKDEERNTVGFKKARLDFNLVDSSDPIYVRCKSRRNNGRRRKERAITTTRRNKQTEAITHAIVEEAITSKKI